MEQLSQMICTACRGGEPTVTDEESVQLLAQVPEWHIEERDNMKRLVRVFTFNSFVDALAFTNKVGELAESQGHHPMIITEWGKVTVEWWTHKIHGLHQNDFIMAAKTDQAYNS